MLLTYLLRFLYFPLGFLFLLSGCTLSFKISDLNNRASNSNSSESSLTRIEQINITNLAVSEYQPIGFLVGELYALSSDGTPINASYTLVDNAIYTDNQFFEIIGSRLVTKTTFFYASKNVYTIKIKAHNQALISTEKIFSIAISDLSISLFTNPIFYISSETSFQITPDNGNPTYQYSLTGTSSGTVTTLGNYLAPTSSNILQSSQVTVTDSHGETQTITLYSPPAGSVDATYQQGDINTSGINQFSFFNGTLLSATSDASKNTLVLISSAGPSKFIARISPTGLIDMSFGISGKIDLSSISSSTINYISIDSNGYIYAAGSKVNGAEIFRYTPSGSLDTTFGTLGKTITCSGCSGSYSIGVYGISFDSSNNFYVVGNYTVVPFFNTANFIQRFLPSGTTDTNFNSGNAITSNPSSGVDQITGLDIDSSGNAVIVGYYDWFSSVNGNTFLKRYSPSGALDINISTDASGASTNDGAYAVKIDSSNRILVLIYNASTSLVRRYLSNGTLDNTFGSSGTASVNLSAVSANNFPIGILLDNQQRIIISGRHQNQDNLFFFRLSSNGVLDTSWGTNGITIVDPNPLASDSAYAKMTLLPNNEILISTNTNSGLFASFFKFWP